MEIIIVPALLEKELPPIYKMEIIKGSNLISGFLC